MDSGIDGDSSHLVQVGQNVQATSTGHGHDHRIRMFEHWHSYHKFHLSHDDLLDGAMANDRGDSHLLTCGPDLCHRSGQSHDSYHDRLCGQENYLDPFSFVRVSTPGLVPRQQMEYIKLYHFTYGSYDLESQHPEDSPWRPARLSHCDTAQSHKQTSKRSGQDDRIYEIGQRHPFWILVLEKDFLQYSISKS